MSESPGSLSCRLRSVVPLAKGAFLLSVLVASCKAPQTGEPAAGVGAATTPQGATAGAALGAPSTDANSDAAAVDQINAFLLEARNELLAHREARTGEELTSDNSELTWRTAAPEITNGSTASIGEASVAGEGAHLGPNGLRAVGESSEAAVTHLAAQADPGEGPGVEAGVGPEAVDPVAVDAISLWIRSLMESAAGSDAPLRHHLTVAIVLGMSAPEQSFQPEGLSELTGEEQELVRIVYEQFRVLGQDLELGGDSQTVVEVLSGLIELVQAEEPFRIARMDLCSWVRDFGDVDVIDPPTFAPTERPRFIWYVELAGVKPTQDVATEAWLYEFDLRLEMLTRDTGIPVIAPIEGTVRHSATSRVRDLFLRDLFEIPSDLQFDWYTTKLTITDRQTGAQAQKSYELLWVPNLAAGASHLARAAAAAPAN